MFDEQQVNNVKNWLGSGSVNIFGRPFAGKDNQCQRLIKVLGGNSVGGGDILRNSEIPQRSLDCLRAGKLIPSDDYVDIVLPYLSQPHFANKPLFLSAVGRWHGEEEGVIEALKLAGHPLKAVVYLNINDDDSYNRWLARNTYNDRKIRPDDTVEILKTRFAEFQEKTIPVIDYYRQLGMLIEIDGKRTREQVTQDIIKTLDLMRQHDQN